MYAHYFKSGKAHSLVISAGPRPIGQTIAIENKAAARVYAKANNLTAWNF